LPCVDLAIQAIDELRFRDDELKAKFRPVLPSEAYCVQADISLVREIAGLMRELRGVGNLDDPDATKWSFSRCQNPLKQSFKAGLDLRVFCLDQLSGDSLALDSKELLFDEAQ
jgi:hypothetical protein